ncbi:MAG: hypothetical protein GEU28_07385 [Dehalococcoidia bacterium]|nr:hypothetical protein [Dehalococcoidia bacterium]
MNVEALPFTLLILLAELSVGSLILLVIWDARSILTPAFVKLTAAILLAFAAAPFVLAVNITPVDEVDGYPLDSGLMPEIRWALGVFLALHIPYVLATLRESKLLSLATGGVASIAGLAAIVLLAQLVALPTWGTAATVISLLVGTAVVGAVSLGMVLGHWYLVTPRLPDRPLTQMTFFAVIAIVLQGILMVANLLIPVRIDPAGSASDIALSTNPVFWMRIGPGLLFSLVLVFMAWQASRIHAMQSATGLLYLAMGAVLGGEAVARGLMFVTAIPL